MSRFVASHHLLLGDKVAHAERTSENSLHALRLLYSSKDSCDLTMSGAVAVDCSRIPDSTHQKIDLNSRSCLARRVIAKAIAENSLKKRNNPTAVAAEQRRELVTRCDATRWNVATWGN